MQQEFVEMPSIEENKYFLQMLVFGANQKQSLALLKEINPEQHKLLKTIANDVLDEIIPLTSQQYKSLVPHKNFIRKLGREKVSKAVLIKNFIAVRKLASLVIDEDEVCAKVSSGSTRGVGKGEKATSKNNSIKDSGGGSDNWSTDEESETSEVWNECYKGRYGHEANGETDYDTEIEEAEDEGEEAD